MGPDGRQSNQAGLFQEMVTEWSSEAFMLLECPTGRLLRHNRAAAALVRTDSETLSRATLRELVDPASWSSILGLMSGQVPELSFTGLLRTRDHRTVPVQLVARQVSEGLLQRVLVSFRDITAETTQRRTESALRESEERYLQLFETATDAVLLMDGDRYVECNQRALEMFACSREQFLGQTPYRFSTEYQEDGSDSRAVALAHISAAMAGEPRNFEWRHARCDHSPFYAEVNLRRLELGTRPLLLAVVRDITERKRHLETLSRSEQRFREIFERSEDAICVVQRGGLVVANPRFAAMARLSGTDVVTARLAATAGADDQPFGDMVALLVGQWCAAGTLPRQFSTQLPAPDGTALSIDVSLSAIHWDDKPAILCVIRDVTEQRQLELELQKARRMDAIGRLAGGVAHDLNNLLTAIGGAADLCLDASAECPRLRGLLSDIASTSRRASELTRQLLAFGRRQVLSPKVLDLNRFLGEMDGVFRGLLREDTSLILSLGSELRHVRVDPAQLSQVVMNLVVNAREAMPGGGTLSIETCNVEENHEVPGGAHASPHPYFVQMAVSDNGVGMSQDVIAQIFEPFFTTREEGAGTGLGLATVYGIVKQSGGHISVQSEPGAGTTFRVFLPAVPEDVELSAPNKPAPTRLEGRETILVVEDEVHVRRVITDSLRRYGYHVIEAEDGAEALRACSQRTDPVDLVVADVVMPRMGGIEFARRLGDLWPDVRVLFISGYSDAAVGGALRHDRGHDDISYLAKPFRPDDLARQVRQNLDIQ